MSDEAATETETKTPPKKRRFLSWLFPKTIAGKAALFTSVVLWTLLAIVWVIRLFGADSVRVAHSIRAFHAIAEILLVTLIPVVLYYGIKRWNRVIEGEFPDIDRAWEAGMAALEAKGIAARDYPIFMVLGSSDGDDERGLMEALDSPLLIHGVPGDNGVSHALKWYLTSDALYLFCTGASSLSDLMGRLRSRPSSRVSIRQFARSSEVVPAKKADVVSAALPAANPATVAKQSPAVPSGTDSGAPAGVATAPSAPVSTGTFMGTIGQHTIGGSAASAGPSSAFGMPAAPAAKQVVSQMKPAPQQMPPAFASPRSAVDYQGTLMIDHSAAAAITGADQGSAPAQQLSREVPMASGPAVQESRVQDSRPTATIKPAHMSVPQVSASKRIALPEHLDTSDQLKRLAYVCKLLKRFRRPVCGVNGAVTLLPFELSQVGPLQLAAVAQSARNDVTTIQKTLGVRFPVTALLVGLEREAGFIELVRRLGADLLSRRLGGRFDLRSRPTPNELNTHSDRLCDAFEDWVYRLFSREDGLEQQRGNRKLYSLTCRIRHELKPRLRIVLGQAFGCDSNDSETKTRDDDSFFFSGCYFAASGAETGQPAFVKGVLQDKLKEEQSKVEWSRESIANHRYFRLVSLAGWGSAVLLFLALMLRLLAS
ncbi:type VI secretion protein IcmF/TssM N-terminal domain-containing protein [Rhodopirellula sp. MGV]|uniref:type VI secretion protein IcmF/TssM N-terminal domain-containing protein n=1 Tax=Rhodopirellula sp. MGV TaxID=2023130 RepID=UPI000B95E236|nr:type VI secretion protein IcmF/TssM N-terminal domain-containing protein [Rhodopirellula sp. MGV]OYP35804.1 hypothetical protein CGZ80_10415 [Rhodopirellula sp. MGV]PNY36383.1 hypothetical protein C2E31_13195 [Rhodopirellula baltica]